MSAPVLLVAGGVHRDGEGAERADRAVLLRGDRVVWVGADPATAPTPASTSRVDLGGAWITPAFVDAHVHGTSTGLLEGGVDLAGTASLAEALDRVRRHVAARDDRVVLGAGWDDSVWPEGRPPSAAELADAAPGRTVLLDRVDVHSCVVDPITLAGLSLADLDGVGRDEAGDPTGWLREEAGQAARRLVRGRLSRAQRAAARSTFAAAAAALGIASVHEMGHPGIAGLDDALAWRDGRWPVEVLVWWASLDAAEALGHGLRPGGDLFVDGSIGSRTAAVSCGYRDGGHGELLVDAAAVAGLFTAATRAGVGAGVHAIGDRAVTRALDGVAAAVRACGADAVRACRHRIEHLEIVDREHVARAAGLGIVASMQPAFDAAWGGVDRLYAQRFGAAVAVDTNPLDWFAGAGVPLAFGSDTTVTPLDPWGGVVAAEQHRGGHGIGRLAAFAAATVGGRFAARQDDVGTVTSGARADLALWDRDPLTADDPRASRCLATIVAGELTYGDVPDLPRLGERAAP